jgi:hypothetical protein
MCEIQKTRYATLVFSTEDREKERLIEHADSVRCLEFVKGEIYDKNIGYHHYLFKFQNKRTIRCLRKIIVYESMWCLYNKISNYKDIFHKIKSNSISEIIIGSNPNSEEKSWLTKEEKKNISREKNRIHNNNYYYRKTGKEPNDQKIEKDSNIKEVHNIDKTKKRNSKYQTKIKNIEEYCKLFPNDKEYFSHFLDQK